jgi:hypothetical protein
MFRKCLNTSKKKKKTKKQKNKKTQAHLQRVHNNCAKFGECQPKAVRGVDYTK